MPIWRSGPAGSVRRQSSGRPFKASYGNQIIDGRNRYLACVEVGVEPEFRAYEGDDPLRFVIDQNINRRHLGTAQRALIAAGMANIRLGQNQFRGCTNSDTLSLDDAASMFSVGRNTVAEAKRILASGRQDIIDLVKSGELSVNGAMKLKAARPGGASRPMRR